MAKKAPKKFNLLDHLEKEEAVEAFVAVLPNDSEITFPNPLDMDYREAQRFMSVVSADDVPVDEVFKEWLSEEDYASFEASKISLKAAIVLARAASEHYGSAFGDPKA